MLVSIDAASEQPIYAQIADSVRRSVGDGVLRTGDKLPPAGEIATGLGVNKHTVLHAYQELRDEGLVDLRRGRGAVVTSLATEVVALRHEVARIAERARALGISGRTLAALVDLSAESADHATGQQPAAGPADPRLTSQPASRTREAST